MTTHPRILFITPHAFNKVTGGGITFSNLFAGWPKAALATVHNDPEPTTDTVCDTYYVLGRRELDYAFPFNLLSRAVKAKVGAKVGEGRGGSASNPAAKPGVASRIKTWVKTAAVAVLGESFPERGHMSAELEAWIKAYKPQVIYTILGSNGMMSLIEQVRRRFDVPVVVHVMDDWMASYHRKGLLAPMQRRAMMRWVDHFMAVASCRMAISPAMGAAYRERFGHDFAVFQNTIDVGKWKPIAPDGSATRTPADLVYIGSIFPNAQLESLVECCRAVAALNDGGFPARLTIASPSGHGERYRDKLAVHPSIQVEGPILDDDAFFKRIAEADALLLPVNFDADSVRFIRYSMPTKVPAYLAAGGPVLVYGPSQTAQVSYAQDAGWGLVVDRHDQNELMTGMRRILSDTALRTELCRKARAAAMANHDADTVRARFQGMLRAQAQSDA